MSAYLSKPIEIQKVVQTIYDQMKDRKLLDGLM